MFILHIQKKGFYVSKFEEIPQLKIIHKWLIDDEFLSNMTIHCKGRNTHSRPLKDFHIDPDAY